MSQKNRAESPYVDEMKLKMMSPEVVHTNTTKRLQIVSRLRRGKEYREYFVENEISVGIPFQIRAMRENRSWTQKELGERTGKRQSVISQLENPDYGKLTLSTLKNLAAAFDVALMVRFVPFSELIARGVNLSDEDQSVPSFADDKNLLPVQQEQSAWQLRFVISQTTGQFISQLSDITSHQKQTIKGTEVENVYSRKSATKASADQIYNTGGTYNIREQRSDSDVAMGFQTDFWRNC